MNNRKALEQLSNKEIALYWDKLQERLGEHEMLGAQDDCGVSEDYEVLEEVKSCVSTKNCVSRYYVKDGGYLSQDDVCIAKGLMEYERKGGELNPSFRLNR